MEEVAHGRSGMETAVIRMYRDFLDSVQNNRKPLVGVDIATTAAKIAWLAEMSSEQGRKVSWNDLS